MIGSVKSNVGHSEPAAGCVSLLKVATMFRHRAIPPSIHFSEPSPTVSFERLGLRVQTTLGPWPDDGTPLIAGVNSFGIGGTNAHVIVEAPPALEDVPAEAEGPQLMVLSAQNADALRDQATRLADWLESDGARDARLADVAHTLATRREAHANRLAVPVADAAELRELLRVFAAGDGPVSGMTVGRATEVDGRCVFVYCGQGPQWWAMGRESIRTDPDVRSAVEACSAAFERHAGWSLLDAMLADESTSRIGETAVAQPAIVALQIGLTAWWRVRGIVPDAVVGHSVGEITAAHVGGTLSLDDAMRVIYHRSRLMQRAAGRDGKMLAVELTEADARALIAAHAGAVDVGAVNGPRSVTLSGDAAAIEALARTCEAQGVFCRALTVQCAFHSHHMEPLMAELADVLADLRPAAATMPLYSTLTGTAVEQAFDAEHWAREIREPVRFAAAIATALGNGGRLFVEVGPHPVLSADVAATARASGSEIVQVHSLRRGADDVRSLLAALGAVHVHGRTVDWRALHPGRRRCLPLPTYAWQHERCWLPVTVEQSSALPGMAAGDRQVVHPLLGRHVPAALPGNEQLFDGSLDLGQLPYLAEHRVRGAAVLPAAATVEMALAALRLTSGPGPWMLRDLELAEALFLDPNVPRPVQVVVKPNGGRGAQLRVCSRAPDDAAASPTFVTHAVVRGAPIAESDAVAASVDVAALRARCAEPVAVATMYDDLAAAGLGYGPAFRSVTELARGDGEALGTVALGDDCRADAEQYLVHPAILDGALHCLFAAAADRETGGLFLPRSIAALRCDAPVGERVFCHATVDASGPDELNGSVRLLDESGRALLDARGIRLVRVATGDDRRSFFEVHWPEVGAAASRDADASAAAPDLPTCAAFVPALQAQYDGWLAASLPVDHVVLERHLESAAIDYMAAALRDLGWQPGTAGEDVATLASRLGVTPRLLPLFGRMLTIVSRRDAREPDGARAAPRAGDPLTAGRYVVERHPEAAVLWRILQRCGAALPAVLRGERDPLELLFPDGASDELATLYDRSILTGAHSNALLAAAVTAIGRAADGARPLRVLELGAGTGGTTEHVLAALPDDAEYTFTDVSPLFLERAQQRFGSRAGTTFRRLDLERDLAAQGFSPRSFDLVVAANVLHATTAIRRVLRRVRSVLAPGGRLLVWELTRPTAYWDLVFGLTAGWWAFGGSLAPARPCVARTVGVADAARGRGIRRRRRRTDRSRASRRGLPVGPSGAGLDGGRGSGHPARRGAWDRPLARLRGRRRARRSLGRPLTRGGRGGAARRARRCLRTGRGGHLPRPPRRARRLRAAACRHRRAAHRADPLDRPPVVARRARRRGPRSRRRRCGARARMPQRTAARAGAVRGRRRRRAPALAGDARGAGRPRARAEHRRRPGAALGIRAHARLRASRAPPDPGRPRPGERRRRPRRLAPCPRRGGRREPSGLARRAPARRPSARTRGRRAGRRRQPPPLRSGARPELRADHARSRTARSTAAARLPAPAPRRRRDRDRGRGDRLELPRRRARPRSDPGHGREGAAGGQRVRRPGRRGRGGRPGFPRRRRRDRVARRGRLQRLRHHARPARRRRCRRAWRRSRRPASRSRSSPPTTRWSTRRDWRPGSGC